MKKRKEKYESPQTRRTRVNLESGICSSSANIQNPNENNGRIEEHAINKDFSDEFNWANNSWDQVGDENNN